MATKIKKNIKIFKALKLVRESKEKCLIVEDEYNKFLGIVTDGDIRRGIIKNISVYDNITKVLNNKPYFVKNKIKFNQKNLSNVNYIPIINNQNNFIRFQKLKKKKRKKIQSKYKNVPFVIMAGGKGTRLKPYTNFVPKPLITVNNNTLLENIFHFSSKNGFNNFFVTLNYMKKEIIDYLKKNKYFKNFNIIHERKPLGTASSLKYFTKKKYKDIIVSNCDVLFNFKIDDVLKFHFKNNSIITIVSAKKKFYFNYGVFNFEKNFKNVFQIEEKPIFEKYVNTGFYIINTKALLHIKTNKQYDMTELISDVLKKKEKVLLYEIEDKDWLDFGEWKNFERFEKIFNKKKWALKY